MGSKTIPPPLDFPSPMVAAGQMNQTMFKDFETFGTFLSDSELNSFHGNGDGHNAEGTT